MKLRAITLADTRQFTQPVRVAGIEDGLNVLSAPNESGKSTLFDAIHAVFFIPHRSSKIGPLRPSVGGNPEIALELEHEGLTYRLHKRWGRGKSAEVTQGGRLIAKGDEAETWIAALTKPADEGGPAGLLWVRQGLVALDEETGSEKKHSLAARRDLLSSVTGEFEALTGGKRMDRALGRAREDLNRLETQRGAKAGGPLDRAQRTVMALEETLAELEQRSARLREALAERRALRRELAGLENPDEARARAERLTGARAAFGAAERHGQALTAAEMRLTQAQSEKESAERRLAARAELERKLQALDARIAASAEHAGQTAKRRTEAGRALNAAKGAVAQARSTRRAADTALQAGLAAAARSAGAVQRRAQTAALAEAEALVATLPDLRRGAETGPDARQILALEAAQADLNIARARAHASAPQITLDYAPGAAPVSHDGAPLPGGEAVALPGRSVLDLPGIGQMVLEPGTADDGTDAVTQAETRLRELMQRAGTADLSAARAQAQARLTAENALREAQRDLQRLAPDGIDALRAKCAGFADAPDDAPGDAPENTATDTLTDEPTDLAPLQSAAESARRDTDSAEEHLEAARQRAGAAQETALRARLDHDALVEKHRDLAAQLAASPAADSLHDTLAAASASHEAAAAAHRALVADAPDLSACRAALARAEDVERRARDETSRLRVALAGLDAVIETQSGDGIDEDHADTALQLERARAELAALRHEVAVLRSLIAALESAQASARDRYFAPVLAELRPMLRLLWPDATLSFDGDSLLPDTLVRAGVEEPIGSLSGGTREQIALLVRLAFARLLARRGQHTPVILDDALVYSDDDRIEQMFTALYAQANDLQILVLSCRSRALRALGGKALRFEAVADTPPGDPG